MHRAWAGSRNPLVSKSERTPPKISVDAISVRVSREAKAELQKIADGERRTLSQLVAIIIDDFLKARAGKKGFVQDP